MDSGYEVVVYDEGRYIGIYIKDFDRKNDGIIFGVVRNPEYMKKEEIEELKKTGKLPVTVASCNIGNSVAQIYLSVDEIENRYVLKEIGYGFMLNGNGEDSYPPRGYQKS